VSRLADPNTSHATIVSPETFRVIKGASQQDAAASSSKAQPAQARDSPVLEAACRHLISADARMEPLIARHHCRIFSAEGLAEKIDPFESLVSSMISQLITGAAARTIKARFIRLFADSGADDSDAAAAAAPSPPFPRPSQVAAASVPTIQSAGIARRKAEWIMNLANKFVSGELSAQMMAEAPYEDLRRTLLALPGLGEWTVEMFACFALKRLDVFSVGDLGVQRGMAAFEGRDVARMRSKGGKWKYMARKEMEATAAKFAPYRSVYMWYMWRVEETDISTLE
jgi:DNA-3-methyladenine glycosylase II